MRISRDQMLMEVAQAVARRGTCSRKQVGVIVARDGRVLVTGYNGTPARMEHCDHNVGPFEAPCVDAVHAEANAIAFAARHGIRLEGGDLYTTYAPCLGCAKLIINAGIRAVISKEVYHDPAGANLLVDAGLKIGHLV